MVELEPQPKFYEGLPPRLVFILAGSALFFGAYHSDVPRIALLIPFFFVVYGIYTSIRGQRLFYDEARDQIVVTVRFLGLPPFRRSHPKSDFNAIVVDKGNYESSFDLFKIVLDGKVRLEFNRWLPKEKALLRAAELKNMFNLKVEDWSYPDPLLSYMRLSSTSWFRSTHLPTRFKIKRSR